MQGIGEDSGECDLIPKGLPWGEMVPGFLLDRTSGTTSATLEPASGETNAERSERRDGRNLGPGWPAGELNQPVQKPLTSGLPVEQDVKIVHFQQL